MSFESLPRLNSSQSALCKTLFLAPAFGNRLKCHKGGGSGEVREVMASFDGEIAGAIGSIRFGSRRIIWVPLFLIQYRRGVTIRKGGRSVTIQNQ